MNRILAMWQRHSAPIVDVLAVALAAADAVINISDWSPLTLVLIGVACFGLLLRRRVPLIVFLLTIPASLTQDMLVAPIIALFTLACSSRHRWLLAGCAALFAVVSAVPWPLPDPARLVATGNVVSFIYQLATAAAPVFLGQLVQARHDLARRLVEMEQTKERERVLYAETVLGRERSQLAREMHDVVSHQVSLIAVQAGALQVTAGTAQDRERAAGIRSLSVRTLGELRTMVTLLRLAGTTGPGLAPQPTMADLRRLIDSSGIDVHLEGALPADVNAAGQRALYRTVQEALTNVRKHAPGASVSVDLWETPREVGVTIENEPPTRPALPLPGSGVGLLGLRERAELLNGSLHASGTPDGGYVVRMSLPRHSVQSGWPTE